MTAWYSCACAPNNAAIAVDTSSVPAASTADVEPAATAFAAVTEAPIRARSEAAALANCGATRTKDIATSEHPIQEDTVAAILTSGYAEVNGLATSETALRRRGRAAVSPRGPDVRISGR